MPKTGRTHQIRIHLKYAGFPIANDPCYGGIVFNGLKDLDNPDFLKLYQISNENIELNKDKSQTVSSSDVMCYKIWLHAYHYKFESYDFETQRPDWSLESYKVGHKFQ